MTDRYGHPTTTVNVKAGATVHPSFDFDLQGVPLEVPATTARKWRVAIESYKHTMEAIERHFLEAGGMVE